VSVRYPWLLFDLDDTLFDFRAAEAHALEQALAAAGVTCDPAWLPVYRQVNAEAWRALEDGRTTPERLRVERFEILFDRLGLDLDPAAFGAGYLRQLGTQARLVDGALAMLEAVLPGRRLAIITNGLAEVQRPRLAASVIADRIADVVISGEVGVAKPDPAIFDIVLERMGRPSRHEVLMVGDSLSSDVAGGLAAGLDTVWFNPAGLPGRAGLAPTHEIRSFDELVGLLEPSRLGEPDGATIG
jgi:YjjG family noncanonical pyrimidine nucleotidase